MKPELINYQIGDLVKIVQIMDDDEDIVLELTDKFVGTILEIISIDDDDCPINCKTEYGSESFKLTEIELFKRKPLTLFD